MVDFFLLSTLQKMDDENILYFTPDQGIELLASRKCKDCGDWKPVETRFYHRAKRCKRCYDRYYMERADENAKVPLEMEIEKAVERANRRSRFRRSKGLELTVEEALTLWKACEGKCANCRMVLSFRWMPRHVTRNLGILDRIDTSRNGSYHGNCQWLCQDCNTEKSGFDLVNMTNRDMVKLKRKVRRLKRKLRRERSVYYQDILIQG